MSTTYEVVVETISSTDLLTTLLFKNSAAAFIRKVYTDILKGHALSVLLILFLPYLTWPEISTVSECFVLPRISSLPDAYHDTNHHSFPTYP
jgi:hypothetical protein